MKRMVMQTFVRVIAIILAVVMLVPAWPGGRVEVEAASKTPTVFSQSDKEWASEPYGAFGATIKSAGCGLLSLVNIAYYFNETEKIDPKFLAQYAYKYKLKEGYLADSLYRNFASDWGAYYGFSYIGMGRKTSDIKSNLIEGKAVIINAPNHMMSVVDYNPDNNSFLLLNSASYWSKFKKSWGWITYDELDAFNQKSFYIFKSSKKINYTITAENVIASKTTNNSTELNVSISPKAYVKRIGVFYGSDKSAIKSVDLNTPHENKGEVNYKLLMEDADGKSMSSYSFDTEKNTTSKGWKIKFNPNTTYYYKFIVKLSNGNWYISDMNSFKTKNDKPKQVTNLTLSDNGVYSTGSKATISWKKSDFAEKYKVSVYNSENTEVWSQEKNEKGLSAVTSKLNKAGTYTVKVVASNSAGDSPAATKTLQVNADLNVTFKYNNDGQTSDQNTSVKYGESVTTPKAPSRTGYAFVGWRLNEKTIVAANTKVANVKSDLVYTAEWTPNEYVVKFVDSYDNSTIASGKYPFGSSIDLNDYPSAPEHKYYSFENWSEDKYSIEAAAHTIYARYKWDLATDLGIEITNIERAKSNSSETKNDGYSITTKVTVPANVKNTIKGRVVIALKTAKGRLLTETESAAFVIYPGSEAVTKQIEIFVPYEATSEDELAALTEAYVVNNYNSAGIISNVEKDTLKTLASNTDEWLYMETKPVKGQNGVTAVDSSLDKVTYDLITTTTKDSLATSMAGFDLKTSAWVQTETGTVNYVKSWPTLGNSIGSKFDNKSSSSPGVSIYNTYNKTPVTLYENSTTQVTASENIIGYIYYHWCRNYNTGNLEHVVKGEKKTTSDSSNTYNYHTFEAFYSTVNLPTEKYKEQTYYSAKNNSSLKSKSKDSYFWFRIPVYHQSWKKSLKKFTYTKTETETGKTAATMSAVPTFNPTTTTANSNGVTLTTTVAKSTANKIQLYAYKTTVSVTHSDKNLYDISVDVGKDYSAQKGIVYVYKDAQPSDYTTEYIGEATVDSAGKIIIDDAQMREACTDKTGDFTISVAFGGETTAIVAGKIEAPKPEYNVTFRADNTAGESIEISTQKVKEGDSAILPDESDVPARDGYHFTGWSRIPTNVQNNINIVAEYEKDQYAVVFVDWDNQNINIEKYEYGNAIKVPELPDTAEDTEVVWKLFDNENGATQLLDDYNAAGGTVTGDMVIAAEYSLKPVELTIVRFDEQMASTTALDIETIDEGSLLTENLEYADVIQLETYEEEYGDDVIFAGWKNAETKEFIPSNEITEDMTIYPVYYFAETVETPEADVITGEFDSAQTVALTCETQGAVIWYTTDGTDPEISSTVQQYTGSITLTSTCELNFFATAMGMNNSAVASELYAINTGSSGAVYHLVTIYTNIGDDTDGFVYEELVRDSRRIDISGMSNVEGYTFDGLYYDEAYKEEFLVNAEVVTERLILYAKYTPLSYTVTFKDYDGSVIKTGKVLFGDGAELPDTPKREGYRFTGWTPDGYDCIAGDSEFTARYVEESQYATVTLPKSSRSAIAGYTIKLKATVLPENLDDVVLLWESSNPDVADVDESGNVALIKPGVAVIRVTVESTGEYAECTITVSKNTESSIVCEKNSYLDVDSQGYLRRVAAGSNTVAELRMQFNNDGLVFYGTDGQILQDEDLVGTGTSICLETDGETLDRIIVVMTGDFNGDGKIQNKDVSMLDQCINGMRQGEEYQMLAVDVNGDGSVDTKDSVTLSRYLVGKEQI